MRSLEEVRQLLTAASTSSMRRTVISRAYYVSFRTLVGVTTPLGFRQKDRKAREGVHQRLRTFLMESDDPVLRKIGQTRIGDLYRSRLTADYRFSLPITQVEAADALKVAQDIHDWITDANLKSAF